MHTLKSLAIHGRTTLLIGLFFVSLLAGNAQANTDQPSAAVQKMATIMHRLKHFPSPQGKQELQVIINDSASNENERALARAMLNLQHKALADDKARMKHIMDDADARASERELAGIIYHLDHRPSASDKQKLQAMMQ